MTSTYKIQPNDTFDLIARKKYGTENYSGDLMCANPGFSEPLSPGTFLFIPDFGVLDIPQKAQVTNKNEVSILIDGIRFRYWTLVRVTKAFDGISQFELSSPFDSGNEYLKKTFKPFSFKQIEISVGEDKLFTGVMVNVNPSVGKEKTLSVSGYSLAGSLNDCNPPASASNMLEFDSMRLSALTERVARLYGIKTEYRGDPKVSFKSATWKIETTALSFLTTQANNRGFVLSDTPEGKLLVWKEIETGVPVARLAQGQSPLVSVTPNFAPQEYYSHISGLYDVSVGFDGTQYTVQNTHYSGKIRPHTYDVQDELEDIKGAVKSKMGRMFGNAIAYTIEVSTWRDQSDALWQPNTFVALLAPDAMIYSEYIFMIRSVTFERERDVERATLTLSLPGSFRGVIPVKLPWE